MIQVSQNISEDRLYVKEYFLSNISSKLVFLIFSKLYIIPEI